jgi:hypothetical protein
MNLNRESLAKIIEEELGEILRPRMSVGQSGLRPPGVPVAPAPEMAPEQPEGPVMVEVPIGDLQDLYGMIKAEYDLSKADDRTPERITKTLSAIAGALVKLL